MLDINDFIPVGRCPYRELTDGTYFATPDEPETVCQRTRTTKTPDLDKSWPGLSQALMNATVILLEKKA